MESKESRASMFVDLPPEILFMIYDHIASTDVDGFDGLRTLSNIAQTCKHLNLTKPTKSFYQRIKFEAQNPSLYGGMPLIQRFVRQFLIPYPERRYWVRDIEFVLIPQERYRLVASIADVLELLPFLRKVTIRTQRRLTNSEISDSRLFWGTHQGGGYQDVIYNMILRALNKFRTHLQSVTVEHPGIPPHTVLSLLELSKSHCIDTVRPVNRFRLDWCLNENMDELSTPAGILLKKLNERKAPSFLNEEPDSKLTKLEVFTNLPPIKTISVGLLKQHPYLKELSWSVRDQGETNAVSVRRLYIGLRPLQDVLVELQLPRFDLATTGNLFRLTFTSFTALRCLRIHTNLLFLDPKGIEDKETDDISSQLPPSLVTLELLFNDNSWLLRQKVIGNEVGQMVHTRWLMKLAQKKDVRLPYLSEIILRRRTMLASPTHEMTSTTPFLDIQGIIPDHPCISPNVLNALHKAGMKLSHALSVFDYGTYYRVEDLEEKVRPVYKWW